MAFYLLLPQWHVFYKLHQDLLGLQQLRADLFFETPKAFQMFLSERMNRPLFLVNSVLDLGTKFDRSTVADCDKFGIAKTSVRRSQVEQGFMELSKYMSDPMAVLINCCIR